MANQGGGAERERGIAVANLRLNPGLNRLIKRQKRLECRLRRLLERTLSLTVYTMMKSPSLTNSWSQRGLKSYRK
jgi:ubiquinone biosynthesis protein UbiJ